MVGISGLGVLFNGRVSSTEETVIHSICKFGWSLFPGQEPSGTTLANTNSPIWAGLRIVSVSASKQKILTPPVIWTSPVKA